MSANRKPTTEITSEPIMNRRPPQLGCWEQFCLVLYNKEEGTFLNRTCLSWAKILGFYAIFYAALAGFFSICMYFMLKTIDPAVPKFYGDTGILQNPGMGVRPHPPVEGNRVVLWHLNSSLWSNVAPDIEMNKFFKAYTTPHNNTVPCDFGARCTQKWPQGSPQHEADSCREELSEGQACEVNYEDWGECAPTNNGSDPHMPCMYFRLNKLYKWRPEYVENSLDIPEMPDLLKRKIDNTPAGKKDRVWLFCEAKDAETKQEVGKVSYYPTQWDGSFPGYFYPWQRQKNYVSPVVAVHFGEMPNDALLSIDCRLWARNIAQDKKHEVAWLSFKLKFVSSDSS